MRATQFILNAFFLVNLLSSVAMGSVLECLFYEGESCGSFDEQNDEEDRDLFREFWDKFDSEKNTRKPSRQDLENSWHSGRCIDRVNNIAGAFLAFSAKNRRLPIPSKSKMKMYFFWDTETNEEKREEDLDWFDHLNPEKEKKIRSIIQAMDSKTDKLKEREKSLYTEIASDEGKTLSVWLKDYKDDEDAFLIAKFTPLGSERVAQICLYPIEVWKNGKILKKED